MKRLLCLLSLVFSAGLTYAADTVELSAVSPREPFVTGTLRVSRVEAEVTMRGQLVETRATLTLGAEAEPPQRMEGRLVFPLPADCVITGAGLDIGMTMRAASVTFKETAARAYHEVVSRMLDPCLVQLLPDGRVSVQVFPFFPEKPRTLRLEFAQTVPPGTVWRFPLKFAAPVPDAVLSADAPTASGTGARRGFTGDWSFPAPAENETLTAHPDKAGRWLFQTFLPPGEPAPPPRHLLILADASLLQAARDAAAERAFLERVFQKMQTGRVTLATFSTVLHGRQEFAVQDGKCEAALAALSALEFDGAPRPGAVNVADVPADLTLVLSTLHGPMGGGSGPRLPAQGPAWVLDSVSRSPSGAARALAAETGGAALDPRKTPEFSFRRRPAVSAENVSGLRFHPMAGGGFLLTGELSGESGAITIGGAGRRTVKKGEDGTAGDFIARERERADFLYQAEEGRNLLQANLRAGKNAAPVLSETTALIVLEQEYDYERFGIPLPPDLAEGRAHAAEEERNYDTIGFADYKRALRRPAGTAGDPAEWHAREKGDESRAELDSSSRNKEEFENYRRLFGSLPKRMDWLEKEESYQAAVEKAKEAAGELSRLSGEYRTSPASDAGELIRRARAEQEKVLERIELLTILNDDGMLHSGGSPGADPFAAPDGPMDAAAPFGDIGAGIGSGAGSGGSGAASAEPFDVAPPAPASGLPDPVASAPESVPASASVPQVAQTFGGSGGWPWGGGIFDPPGLFNPPNGGPFTRNGRRLPDADPTPGPLRAANILDRATRLRAGGRQAEAVRALSILAIAGPDERARLRLLAWLFQEWGEHALALEVLQEVEARFGESDATLRDRGLATLAAGRKEEGVTMLRRVVHHVTWRDTAAFDGWMDAALRVVVECASANGDVDIEAEGPEYELCNWRNPLPAFGGALSFDGRGEAPEDFVLPSMPAQPVKVRFRLRGTAPQSVRVIIVENWGRPAEKERIILLPVCQPGRHEVWPVPAAAK